LAPGTLTLGAAFHIVRRVGTPGDPVAQLVEHPTFNRVVVGSNPTGITNLSMLSGLDT
jgi:hypothetical protein